MKFTNFFPTNDGMVMPTLDQLERWNKDGMKVKYVRLDDAGENAKLQKESDSKDYKMNLPLAYCDYGQMLSRESLGAGADNVTAA
jgi:hypothetical protein